MPTMIKTLGILAAIIGVTIAVFRLYNGRLKVMEHEERIGVPLEWRANHPIVPLISWAILLTVLGAVYGLVRLIASMFS